MALLLTFFPACRNAGNTHDEQMDNAESKMLRFKQFSYVDKEGTGLEAFSFLIPDGWSFEGGMKWVLDNPMLPAVTFFRAYNPEGHEEFEVFPNQCYFWTDNQMLLQLSPPGSKYFGSTVKQPVTAQTALRQIILPRHRSDIQQLAVISDESLPELVEAVGAGQQGGATGAKMRVSYVADGVPKEEEIYCVVETIHFPTQGMFGVTHNTLWYVDYIFSFKAGKGNLEKYADLFQPVISSFRLNPKWYAKYSNVIEYMAQQEIKRIHSIGEFSRMLSRMSDQMREDQLQQFEARNQVYDKVSENFSDYMRGVDKYYDPFEERHIDLPSGYNHAWCNNLGEYIVTESPSFNPNVGSNLTWKPMTPK